MRPTEPKLCGKHRVPVRYVGAPKETLQIAYERGFCDEKQEINGVKVSAFGPVIENKYTGKYTSKNMTVNELWYLLA